MSSCVYMLQSSFTTGEISSDVASRVDLNKYQSALLKAKNVYVRPYGGVYRRTGSVFCGKTKYADKKVRLLRFNFTEKVCYLLEVGEGYIRIWRDGDYLGVEIQVPFTQDDLPNLRYVQSADVMYICSRNHPVQMLMRYGESDWRIEEYVPSTSPFDVVNTDEECEVTPSAKTGDITLTSSKDVFDDDLVGSDFKIAHIIKEQVVVLSGANTTEALLCGRSWTLITRGTWYGNVTLQKSFDGVIWEDIRIYNSSADYNASDNGVVDEPVYLRLVSTAAAVAVTLTISSFTHEAIVNIKSVVDSKNAKASVIAPKLIGLADTKATDVWYISSWNNRNGYPSCATFFQDRLIFASSIKQPNVIWMSKTGDYNNFGVEKADGSVTDDSAVQIPVISRELFNINHLMPGQDLVLLTVGNEWIISGNEVVTPSNLNPKMQTARGCSKVEPQFIGNQVVYVQQRGSAVRSAGYVFESDSYNGSDLTLLAKHLVSDNELVDSAYAQEPDSIMYFVRDDGKMLCLTYLLEQEVYAWSHLDTLGRFENVVRIPMGNKDVIYTVVEREIEGEKVRYIECFAASVRSKKPSDHVMVDSAVRKVFEDKSEVIDGLEHLRGETVQVTADDLVLPESSFVVDDDGKITLPVAVSKAIVGLPYMVELETTNVDVEAPNGLTFGRLKSVAEVILNLENSYGGSAGIGFDYIEDQIFQKEEFFSEGLELFTGNIRLPLPRDVSDSGKVTIKHGAPYPFALNSLVRKVDFK